MWPLVHDGDCCIFEPVLNCDTLKPGDIVFCHVEPHARFFAQQIKRIGFDEIDPAASASASAGGNGKRYFIIGSGQESGWCYDNNIYGRLVEVLS